MTYFNKFVPERYKENNKYDFNQRMDEKINYIKYGLIRVSAPNYSISVPSALERLIETMTEKERQDEYFQVALSKLKIENMAHMTVMQYLGRRYINGNLNK